MAARVNSRSEDSAQVHHLTALQDQISQFQTLLTATQSALQSTRDELKIAYVERDLLRERIRAFERTLFAARSEARGSHQRDLFQ